jgi:hypothetical protein
MPWYSTWPTSSIAASASTITGTDSMSDGDREVLPHDPCQGRVVETKWFDHSAFVRQAGFLDIVVRQGPCDIQGRRSEIQRADPAPMCSAGRRG